MGQCYCSVPGVELMEELPAIRNNEHNANNRVVCPPFSEIKGTLFTVKFYSHRQYQVGERVTYYSGAALLYLSSEKTSDKLSLNYAATLEAR